MFETLGLIYQSDSGHYSIIKLMLLEIGEGLVSSESYHWTRQDSDTCSRVDTCAQFNVSSGNFHWTQVVTLGEEKIYSGCLTAHLEASRENL